MGTNKKESKALLKLKEKIVLRVKAGVAYMNVVKPGWYKKLDISILDLKDSSTCVLGQVFRDFSEGLIKVGLDDLEYYVELHAFSYMGFDLLQDHKFSDQLEYDLLTREWVKVIKSLKSK